MSERVCALTVAGLDPSGGAGILADARAFGHAGAWACAVAAVLTVQSTAGLASVHPVEVSLVRAQAERIFQHQLVRAWKTGALGSTDNVELAFALASQHSEIPLVVDPVIVATRTDAGARLLDDGGLVHAGRRALHFDAVARAVREEGRGGRQEGR